MTDALHLFIAVAALGLGSTVLLLVAAQIGENHRRNS